MTPSEALRPERYINLETFRKDGSGVKTPVWFVNVGDKLGVFSNGKAYKVKRLARDPRVRVAACDVRGKLIESSEWFAGEGRLVTDEPERQRIYKALKAKYGLQMGLLTIGATLSGRRKGWAMIELDLRGDD